MTIEEFEQTLVLIKPDALRNSLTGYVLSILSEFHTGLRFAAAKIVHVSDMLAHAHYSEHRGKPFFPPLIEYITGRAHYPDQPWKRRVIAFVYQGPEAIKKIRAIAGPTDPHVARDVIPGSIRALGTVVTIRDGDGNAVGKRMDNLIHASATADDAEREIKLWFRPGDIPPFMRIYPTETSPRHFYVKGNRIYTSHAPGRVCILAPGDCAWKSDVRALGAISRGKTAACSLDAVAAKYLINEAKAG